MGMLTGQKDWWARATMGIDQTCGICKDEISSKGKWSKKVTCVCGAVSVKGNLLYLNNLKDKTS